MILFLSASFIKKVFLLDYNKTLTFLSKKTFIFKYKKSIKLDKVFSFFYQVLCFCFK